MDDTQNNRAEGRAADRTAHPTSDRAGSRPAHGKQIAAAAVISVAFILVLGAYAAFYMLFDAIPAGLRAALVTLMAVFAAAMVIILVQRIREIRKGENDDLDNY